MDYRQLVVRIDRFGKPDHDAAVELHKGQEHSILWVSESAEVYDISFINQRTPFTKGHTFPIKPFGWAESGAIDSKAEEGPDKRYTYQLKAVTKAGTKEVAADPDVIIRP